jgi:arginase
VRAVIREDGAVREVRVLSVPYELGRFADGVGGGAGVLLERGAEQALGSAGAAVRTEVVELDGVWGTTGYGDVDASFALIADVAGGVRRAREDGAFPVVLGGSCFLGVGVVAGLDEPAPAVVYLDAHADFNHPDSCESGYFDAMGLSVMTGGAWQGLLAAVPGASAVPESRVVLAGARAFDPPEVERLRASRIVQLPPEHLHSPQSLIAALGALEPAPSGVYLHLDLDVLDADVAAVNVYSEPGGLDGDELNALVAAVAAEFKVCALSLTCYDPTYDPEARVPPIALSVLETIARGI